MTSKFVELMEKGLSELSISLDDKKMDQFFRYYELLIEWNKVMNLTTILDMEDVVSKHFIDSLSLINMEPGLSDKICSIIDVGTGAGFPGIPLKIAFPDLMVTLLDSSNKKVRFLNEVSDNLELNDVNAIHGRAEDFGRDKSYREQFDFCVSRAVANLSTLSEYCMPFVVIGGAFISYKSGKIEEELNAGKGAFKLLGGKVETVKTFVLPGTDIDRSLICIRKIEKIAKKYPRKAGMPGENPLK